MQEELQKELKNLELPKVDEQVMNIDPMLATNSAMPVVPTFVPCGRIKSIIILNYYFKYYLFCFIFFFQKI